MNYHGKTTKLGIFKDPIAAFERYKKHKEELIKNMAEKYKDKIPDKVYRAMSE